MAFPDLPFDGYRICTFQPWNNKELIYIPLSLAYGSSFLLSVNNSLLPNTVLVEDALALLFIVYFVKRHYGGLIRVGGVPSLLKKILQDATMYSFIVSTGHVLFLFFEVFAPVSGRPVDLCSATRDEAHIGFDQACS